MGKQFGVDLSLPLPGHPPLPRWGFPASPHLTLRGTVVDRVLMDRAQVFHEAVGAQDPAHLAQEHRGAVRPFRSVPPQCARLPRSWRGGGSPTPPSTHLPASGTKGLASAADGQGALPHARKTGCSRSKRAAAETRMRGRGGAVPRGPCGRSHALSTLWTLCAKLFTELISAHPQDNLGGKGIGPACFQRDVVTAPGHTTSVAPDPRV